MAMVTEGTSDYMARVIVEYLSKKHNTTIHYSRITGGDYTVFTAIDREVRIDNTFLASATIEDIRQRIENILGLVAVEKPEETVTTPGDSWADDWIKKNG